MNSKQELRETQKQNRKTISVEYAKSAAIQASSLFLKHIKIANDNVVAGFLRFGSELDTMPLLTALHKINKTIVLPCVTSDGLVFRKWVPKDKLLKEALGTSSPLLDKPILKPNIVIVPLLAFDSFGGRLGYGGGYYDKALAELKKNHNISAIGWAYDTQLVKKVPMDKHDIPLNAVVTEKQVYRCV